MNYIILDFEWDTVFYAPEKRFINQIVQIGAVKLDEKFHSAGKFEQLVRSPFSKKVSSRFTELTGISTEDMLSGIPLKDAVEKYNIWAGEDFITLTWSTSDLYAVIDNEKLFLPSETHFKIGKYVDLQSYVQSELKLKGKEITNQISLSAAAEMLAISTEKFDMHTALDDSVITSETLKCSYNKERFEKFIRDTRDPEFYNRLTFKSYYLKKFNSPEIKPQHLIFRCNKCKSRAKKETAWKYKNHWFSAQFFCEKCNNRFTGRVLFKMTYNGLRVTKRIVTPKESVAADETTV